METTDTSGHTTWKGSYKAWGSTTARTYPKEAPEPTTNELRFQGQSIDLETGLHYNRYRYYDPTTGRYISRDPIGFIGGLNIYAFAINPVEWIDPYGLKKKQSRTCCPTEVDPCAPDGKTHIVYQAEDPKNPGHVYTGKASGYGSATQVLERRFSGGHHRGIDKKEAFVVHETDSYAAVRGIEHLEYTNLMGGATRQNNPISPKNRNRATYMECAEKHLNK